MAQARSTVMYGRSAAKKRTKKTRRSGEVVLRQWVSRKGVIIYLLMFVLVVIYFLTLTHVRGEVVQLGYEIKAKAEKAKLLEDEVDQLRSTRQNLHNQDRLNKLASQMKLVKPSGKQVVKIVD